MTQNIHSNKLIGIFESNDNTSMTQSMLNTSIKIGNDDQWKYKEFAASGSGQIQSFSLRKKIVKKPEKKVVYNYTCLQRMTLANKPSEYI